MAVAASVMTMLTGFLLATAFNAPEMAAFGWFVAAIGALGLVVNIYMFRRGGR